MGMIVKFKRIDEIIISYAATSYRIFPNIDHVIVSMSTL